MATIIDFTIKENPRMIRKYVEYIQISESYFRVVIEIDENIDPYTEYYSLAEADVKEFIKNGGIVKIIR